MELGHRSLKYLVRISYFLLLCLLAIPFYSQVNVPPPGQKQAPVGRTIRVSVGLVQTDVMVFDRQGRFVSDLKPDQFELRVDGKVQTISFLEVVSAGSPHDEEIWAREEGKPRPAPPQPAAASPNPGRTLLFFLDDWHLAEDNVMRSRTALTSLINSSMGAKDLVAVFAASGQLGTVQQLTNDKAAVLAVLEKFNFQSPGVQDLAWPPMTEAQAVLIEQNDLNAITYFVSAILGKSVVRGQRGWSAPGDRFGNVGRDADEAERITRRRAADLAQVSAGIGQRTLAALRNLLRAAETLPGRKLVFFLSDGFVLQPQRSDVVSRITDLTSAAARAGIVIYSLDTRGLVVGLPTAKTKQAADMTGALASIGYSEISAGQDALNAVAVDTGGRFLKNTNALDTALITALAEMSRYYLLGWHIDPATLKPGKYSTIRASVRGRPDLHVRVRQGTIDLSQIAGKK
jgi:VWFA-related protein